MTDEELQQKVRIVKHLFKELGPDWAAEYCVRLQDTVENQLKNITAWTEAYRKVVDKEK